MSEPVEPQLRVVGADAIKHAACPTIAFHLAIRELSQREVYTVALTAQIQIEPVQRQHDAETRERLVDVFGEPERWGDTARGVLWARQEALVPSFTGQTDFDLVVPCSTDLELATTRYFQAVDDGDVPLQFHFSGSILYRGDEDRLQITRVPWHLVARYQFPLATWREAAPEGGGLVRLDADTFEALRRHRHERALPSLDAAVADLLRRPGGGAVKATVEPLVRSLLYEGYALYPYTSGAAKNATPTPFGIVYPPAYAERYPSTFDRLRFECVLHGEGDVRAEVLFLEATGERHEGVEHRVELEEPAGVEFAFGDLIGRARLVVEPRDDGRTLVRCCVHNETVLEDGDVTRGEALQHSLLSTHVVLETSGGRFLSPLDHPGESVNTYPVLATEADDVVLGAAIVLPDHPRLAPESRGDLFDGTEIEEALLLHVQALSDAEREDIAQNDPAVRAMIERAAAATPEDITAPARPA